MRNKGGNSVKCAGKSALPPDENNDFTLGVESQTLLGLVVFDVKHSAAASCERGAIDPWNLQKFRISYSHSMLTNEERMQRESSLIATIRTKLPEFAKECADDTELAGLRGKEVRVIGKNRSSFAEEETVQ